MTDLEDELDEWLEEKARKTLEDIESGKEKIIPWEEARKRLLE